MKKFFIFLVLFFNTFICFATETSKETKDISNIVQENIEKSLWIPTPENNNKTTTTTVPVENKETINDTLETTTKNQEVLEVKESEFRDKITSLETANETLSEKLSTLETENSQEKKDKEALEKQIETNQKIIEEYKKQVYLIEELKNQNAELNKLVLAEKKEANTKKIIEIFITLILFWIYWILNIFRSKYKQKLKLQYRKLEDEHNPLSLEYYEKMQKLNILFAIWGIILTFWVLTYYNSGIIWYIMLAFSAIIVIMKEFILDIVWFFVLNFSRFKIWDYINFWDKSWDILLINLFNTVIIWKDQNWEYNWETYTIPNYKALTDVISKKWEYENTIIRQSLIVHYKAWIYNITLESFVKIIQETMEELIPRNTTKNVWNFRSFIWMKYKLDINSDIWDFDRININIRWLEVNRNSAKTKIKILQKLENYKNDNRIEKKEI